MPLRSQNLLGKNPPRQSRLFGKSAPRYELWPSTSRNSKSVCCTYPCYKPKEPDKTIVLTDSDTSTISINIADPNRIYVTLHKSSNSSSSVSENQLWHQSSDTSEEKIVDSRNFLLLKVPIKKPNLEDRWPSNSKRSLTTLRNPIKERVSPKISRLLTPSLPTEVKRYNLSKEQVKGKYKKNKQIISEAKSKRSRSVIKPAKKESCACQRQFKERLVEIFTSRRDLFLPVDPYEDILNISKYTYESRPSVQNTNTKDPPKNLKRIVDPKLAAKYFHKPEEPSCSQDYKSTPSSKQRTSFPIKQSSNSFEALIEPRTPKSRFRSKSQDPSINKKYYEAKLEEYFTSSKKINTSPSVIRATDILNPKEVIEVDRSSSVPYKALTRDYPVKYNPKLKSKQLTIIKEALQPNIHSYNPQTCICPQHSLVKFKFLKRKNPKIVIKSRKRKHKISLKNFKVTSSSTFIRQVEQKIPQVANLVESKIPTPTKPEKRLQQYPYDSSISLLEKISVLPKKQEEAKQLSSSRETKAKYPITASIEKISNSRGISSCKAEDTLERSVTRSRIPRKISPDSSGNRSRSNSREIKHPRKKNTTDVKSQEHKIPSEENILLRKKSSKKLKESKSKIPRKQSPDANSREENNYIQSKTEKEYIKSEPQRPRSPELKISAKKKDCLDRRTDRKEALTVISSKSKQNISKSLKSVESLSCSDSEGTYEIEKTTRSREKSGGTRTLKSTGSSSLLKQFPNHQHSELPDSLTRSSTRVKIPLLKSTNTATSSKEQNNRLASLDASKKPVVKEKPTRKIRKIRKIKTFIKESEETDKIIEYTSPSGTSTELSNSDSRSNFIKSINKDKKLAYKEAPTRRVVPRNRSQHTSSSDLSDFDTSPIKKGAEDKIRQYRIVRSKTNIVSRLGRNKSRTKIPHRCSESEENINYQQVLTDIFGSDIEYKIAPDNSIQGYKDRSPVISFTIPRSLKLKNLARPRSRGGGKFKRISRPFGCQTRNCPHGSIEGFRTKLKNYSRKPKKLHQRTSTSERNSRSKGGCPFWRAFGRKRKRSRSTLQSRSLESAFSFQGNYHCADKKVQKTAESPKRYRPYPSIPKKITFSTSITSDKHKFKNKKFKCDKACTVVNYSVRGRRDILDELDKNYPSEVLLRKIDYCSTKQIPKPVSVAKEPCSSYPKTSEKGTCTKIVSIPSRRDSVKHPEQGPSQRKTLKQDPNKMRRLLRRRVQSEERTEKKKAEQQKTRKPYRNVSERNTRFTDSQTQATWLGKNLLECRVNCESPDLYRKLFGPTLDETLLAGLYTIKKLMYNRSKNPADERPLQEPRRSSLSKHTICTRKGTIESQQPSEPCQRRSCIDYAKNRSSESIRRTTRECNECDKNTICEIFHSQEPVRRSPKDSYEYNKKRVSEIHHSQEPVRRSLKDSNECDKKRISELHHSQEPVRRSLKDSNEYDKNRISEIHHSQEPVRRSLKDSNEYAKNRSSEIHHSQEPMTRSLKESCECNKHPSCETHHSQDPIRRSTKNSSDSGRKKSRERYSINEESLRRSTKESNELERRRIVETLLPPEEIQTKKSTKESYECDKRTIPCTKDNVSRSTKEAYQYEKGRPMGCLQLQEEPSSHSMCDIDSDRRRRNCKCSLSPCRCSDQNMFSRIENCIELFSDRESLKFSSEGLIHRTVSSNGLVTCPSYTTCFQNCTLDDEHPSTENPTESPISSNYPALTSQSASSEMSLLVTSYKCSEDIEEPVNEVKISKVRSRSGGKESTPYFDISLGQSQALSSVKTSSNKNYMPCETRFAITKILIYDDFTTYEIYKSTRARPKVLPKITEGVFVLRNKSL